MKRIATWITSGIWIASICFFVARNAGSQELFPDGPGKETLLVVCVQCHSPDRITNAELSAEDWEFTLYDMISRGAPVRKQEIAALKQYLINNYAVESE